ncbi:MAG: hypothetical protein K9I94_01200 [Bacteroidales bacterium]|nr:hypothetical protein [Bacteroidales bacterium]
MIDREGGILGIGRSETLSDSLDLSYFTAADKTKMQELELNVRKAELVTPHPENTFHFEGEDQTEKLIIDNPEDFWSASRYLVVVIKQ